MLKAGLIGVGVMGRGHLDNYMRMKKEKSDIDLVAVCDIDPEKFKNVKVDFNLGTVGGEATDFTNLTTYTDIDAMLAEQKLDLVSIALPTYLHAPNAIKCLNAGINTFCEKPMALNPAECCAMIDAANANGKRLMIGHCLRFWGQYEVLKDITVSGRYGKPTGAYFYRGGDTPRWSHRNWLLKRECGGGALLDQHVHDVDMVNYLFGMPKAVSTVGNIVIPGSGYDIVSTNYIYDGSLAVNAQDDWVMSGGGFDMIFRVNFERGSAVMDSRGLRIAGADEKFYTPEYNKENAYYKEIKYLADCIINDKPNLINPPEDSLNTIRIVEAEIASADAGGVVVDVK